MGSTGAIVMAFFGAVFGAMTLQWQFHVGAATLVLPFLVMRMPPVGGTLAGAASALALWIAAFTAIRRDRRAKST